jgi:hypothetical protein
MKKNSSESLKIKKLIIHSLLVRGVLTKEDLKDKPTALGKLDRYLKKVKNVGLIIDHRESILETAYEFTAKQDSDYAKLFFATFFEHSINSIISWKCEKNHISDKSKKEILRNVNLYGKFHWVLEILNLPPFNEKYFKVINKLCDDRNAFVHYKFIPEFDMERNDASTKINVAEVKKIIAYIKTYESRLFYSKRTLSNLLRSWKTK